MKTIFRIFLSDIKKIRTNLMAFAVMIGICILPALYAWFNIAANWDPYSNTGNIKIAVANCDKGTKLASKEINIGNQIVDNLKKNTQMCWTFVDKQQAENGVVTGEYYASVVIPENFSESFTSILSGKLTRPQITYTLNEKKNAIAPKITDKGAEAIKNQVNESFIDTITTELAGILNYTSEQGNKKFTEITDNIKSAIGDVIDNLSAFQSSISLISTTLDSADTMIANTKKSIPDLEQLLAQSGTLTTSAKDSITAVQAVSTQITAATDTVLNSIDTLYSNTEISISGITGEIAADADKAAEKIRATAEISRKTIDALNNIRTHVVTVGEKLGIDVSIMTDAIDRNIEKQNAIIDILNNGADTVNATGHAPDNFESDVNKLITDSKKDFDGIKTTWNTSVKTAMDTAVNEVFKTLDGISALLSDAGTSVPNIETALTDAQNSLASLKSCLTDLDKIIGNAKDKLTDMQKKVDELILCVADYFIEVGKAKDKLTDMQKKVDDISNDQALIAFIEEVSSDPSSLGEFMSSPVEINTVKVYPVENYGSAMTPFYTILAIWVGSIVLVAVLKAEISRRDIEKLGSNVRPIQAYFGRYMIYLMVSIIQAIIIALGDLLFLKVQCEDPLLFIIAAVVSSIVFSLLIYSLTITFSVIGKALAVIILVLQVAGSGGTFPPEVLPEFFRSILPYLPFRYSINAMREAVAGVYAQSYIEDLLYLLIYVAIALFIGIVLRKPCIRIMKFFNKRLEDTDLII